MPIDQVFAELLQSNDQDKDQDNQGTRTLVAQVRPFQDTPLAAVFDDIKLSEDETFSIADLRMRVYSWLYHARERIRVSNGRVWRREAVMYGYSSDMYDLEDYQNYWEEKKFGPVILTAAKPVSSTIMHLMPEMQVTETDALVVHLTPRVRNSGQVVLHEQREQRFLAQPGVSTHVLTRIEEQYRVYEHGNNGAWWQLGILPFREVREYTCDPDTLRKQQYQPIHEEHDALFKESLSYSVTSERLIAIMERLHEIALIRLTFKPEPLRSVTVIPITPYSTTTFNPDTYTSSQAYLTKVVREVFAPLPPEFTAIPPLPITEN